MKKLILLLAIALIAVSTGLSLEPTRVSVYAPQYQAGTPASSVRVDLVDYSGGTANTLFTGFNYNAGQALLTADDNGVITVNVGQNATVAAAWDAIDASNMNTFWTFDVYINGTLYSQGRIDQQVILQANTSIFNSSGVLVPSGNPSTVGDDNQRFDAVFVKEIEADAGLEGVFIGPTGSAGTAELALQYDNTTGEGIISSNAAAIMNIDANGIDFNGKILDNVAEINDDNNPLIISGAITANQAANVIGDGNEGLQLTISGSPTTQPVSLPNYELVVDGDAKMEYLEVSGFSLTGDFNMNGNTLYDVREVVGATGNGGALLLNATSSVSPVWTANGPITTGTGLFTINGNLDATNGVDVTGDDLTVNDGTNDIFVVDVSAGDIFLGASAAEGIYMNGEVQTNIVPGSASLTLGTDADRWLGAYFLGNSVHVGDANGDNSAELEIGWASDVATFAVNGTTPQFTIDATPASEMLTIDPAGDGTANYTFEEGGLTVSNPGLFGDIVVTDGGILTANGQNFSFLATTGNIDVVVDGRIDVQSAASTIGDGADATQLTVEGLVAGAADALVVQGSTDIDARLNVDGDVTLNEDVTLGDDLATDLTVFDSKVNSVLQPNGNNAHALGTDAERWSALWVDGNAIHVGDASGDNTSELEIGYGSNVATFTVDAGADAELAINSATSVIELDPAGNGSTNYSFAEAGVTINTGANTDLVITEGTIERNNTATETLVFQNTDGANVLDVDIEGKIDVQSAASTIGDGTDAAQLTVEGSVGGANDFIVQGDGNFTGSLDVDVDLNTDGNTTLNGNVDLGDANTDLISFLGRVDTNVEPIADNTHSLGSDALRWADVYVNGGSVHVGDANGEGSAELNIGWGSDVATFSVNGATQLSIDATAASEQILLDPVGDGTNFTFAEASATINTGGNENLVITEEGANRNNAADQTFAFANSSAGNLNVTIDGDLDVDEQITGANTGHSLGTATTDGTVLTIAGLENSGADELVVDGDVQIDGTTNIDGVLTATAAANTIGSTADATQLTILGTTGGTNNSLVVNGNANFDSDVDVDVDLNVDGNTVHVGTLDQQGVVSSSTGDLLFEDNLIPNTDATHDLGSATNQWVDLHLSNNAEIGNDANIANNAVVDGDLRLNDDDQSNYVGFTSPSVVASNVVWTLPATAGATNQVLTLVNGATGELGWGDASLQAAYVGGNTITTSAANGNVEILGDQHLDVGIDIINGTAGDGAGVRVDDDFTVINGDIDFGSSNFTIIGSNGNTTTQGTLTTQGLVTANLGMNVFNANFTVGGSNFVVTPGGATSMQGLVSANAGLNVTGGNFSVGGSNFTVNVTNGNTEIAGTLGLNTATTAGNTANVFVINNFGASTFSISGQMGAHPDGSVVYVRFTGTLPTGVQDQVSTTGAINGFVAVNNGGSWYIVSTY